ncbi:GreA/GreB family elongation factor [Pseudomaricurvus sp.]|uniref:GreA/GreB family elongation factor n=1 Tax=Pseudomaricurvus sp. TaxID=2004510 RepID=UPI003F6B66E2
MTTRIVGPDEFNVSEGKISMDSPLARAMLKKQVDDEVVLRNKEGEVTYYINNIEYHE